MFNNRPLKLERKPEVQQRTGWPKSTLHARIKQGLFTKPVSLGARAVAWPAHETSAIIQAMISGKSDSEIQTLVIELEESRRDLAKVES